MRKSLSLLIVSALLLTLCSCGKGETEVTVTETTTEAQTISLKSASPEGFDSGKLPSYIPANLTHNTVIHENDIQSEGFNPELLPPGFFDQLPAGFECTRTVLMLSGSPDNDSGKNMVRVVLSTFPGNVEQIGFALSFNGWKGGSHEYDASEDYSGVATSNWIEGFWTDGTNTAVISNYRSTSETSAMFNLDVILDSQTAVPKYITDEFPVPQGMCYGISDLTVIDKDGEEIKNHKDPAGLNWCATCQYAGMDFEALDNFVSALDAKGFKITYDAQEYDDGRHIVVNADKGVEGVRIVFLEYLGTITAAFSNNIAKFQ